jgi:putative spermidine/putrescine transport system permease protein
VRYLLAALDLDLAWDGTITRAPEDRRIYLAFLERTLTIASSVTVICAILGFPLAYVLAHARGGVERLLFYLVLLPLWTSLLVRTAAWVVLLQREGVVNGALLAIGLVREPVPLIYNRFGVLVAMTHILLPFMVLPLYSVMRSIPRDQMRAAGSLGAAPAAAFVTVYLPQALPGLGAGCLLVLVLAAGFYITPVLVGGASDQMLSTMIAQFALGTANWSMAAALAVVLVACVFLVLPLYARVVRLERLRVA